MDRLTLRAFVRRAMLLWLMLRLVLVAVIGFAGSGMGHAAVLAAFGSGITLPPVAAAGFAAMVGGVMLVDIRASREELFLANLGVGARHVFALTACVALLLEGAVALVSAVLLQAWAGP